MMNIKIFISSVQSEFVEERIQLYEYISTDALLGRFFVPFLFEKQSALSDTPESIYLQKVQECDIYLGILGDEYGYEDIHGISPTEHEFDMAVACHKTNLIFIKNANSNHVICE